MPSGSTSTAPRADAFDAARQMSVFLTRAEIEELTGYVWRPRQIERLREWGIDPYVSAKGRIQVTWDVVEEVQRRRSGIEARAVQRKGPRPNLSVVT